jgi:hypothetical protein
MLLASSHYGLGVYFIPSTPFLILEQYSHHMIAIITPLRALAMTFGPGFVIILPLLVSRASEMEATIEFLPLHQCIYWLVRSPLSNRALMY